MMIFSYIWLVLDGAFVLDIFYCRLYDDRLGLFTHPGAKKTAFQVDLIIYIMILIYAYLWMCESLKREN